MPQIVTCGSEFLRINAQENSIEYSSNGGEDLAQQGLHDVIGNFEFPNFRKVNSPI